MSCLIAVRNLELGRVDVLTDAAGTNAKDGTVAMIRHKQTITRAGVLVAGSGLWPPANHFVELANDLTLDEIAAAAPELWTGATKTLSAESKEIPHVVLVAGWSQDERVRLHIMQGGAGATELLIDVAGDGLPPVAYVTAPDESACELVNTLAKRFGDERTPFDPVRDGVGIMQNLRRNYPKQFELAQRPAIGGSVQHGVVTRAGVEIRTIHMWPSDKVGQPIDPEDVGFSVASLRDGAAALISGNRHAQSG